MDNNAWDEHKKCLMLSDFKDLSLYIYKNFVFMIGEDFRWCSMTVNA